MSGFFSFGPSGGGGGGSVVTGEDLTAPTDAVLNALGFTHTQPGERQSHLYNKDIAQGFETLAANKRILKRGTIAGKTYRGVLYQGSSTPIVENSNNLTDSDWTKTGCTAELALGGLTKDASWRGADLSSVFQDLTTWDISTEPAINITANSFETVGNGGVRIDATLTVGTAYLIEYNITTSAAALQLRNGLSAGSEPSKSVTTGSGQFIFYAGNDGFYLRNDGAGVTTINSISIREVEAHTLLTATSANATATQATTSASAEHAARFRVFAPSGNTGDVDVSFDDGTTQTTVTKGSFQDITPAAQTLANPTMHIEIATSGDTVRVYDAQVEARAADIPAFAWHVPQGDPVAGVGASLESKTLAVSPTEIDVELLFQMPDIPIDTIAMKVFENSSNRFQVQTDASGNVSILYRTASTTRDFTVGAVSAGSIVSVQLQLSGSANRARINGGSWVNTTSASLPGMSNVALGSNETPDFFLRSPIFALRDNNGQVLQEIESYGPDLASNDFTTWTAQDSWTGFDGYAAVDYDTSGTRIARAVSLDAGDVYEVTYEVYDFVTGSVRIQLSDAAELDTNAVFDDVEDANGTTTRYLRAGASSAYIAFRAQTNPTELKVRNVSIRKVNFKQNIGFGLAALEAFIDNGYSA